MLYGLQGMKGVEPIKDAKQYAAPAFVGASFATANNTAPIAPAMPPDWEPEDILLFAITSSGEPDQVPPPGWASLGRFIQSSNGSLCLFCKRAKTGDTAPSVSAPGQTRMGRLAAYRPRGPVDFQFDQLPVPILGRTGAGGPISIPSSIATRSSRMIVVTGSGNYGAATVSPTPSGLTERGTITSGTARFYLFDGQIRRGEDMARDVIWTGGSNISTVAFLI